MTNKAPTDAYRGAGRPEATYVVERAVDDLARHLGKDPAEIRRINFVPKFTEDRTSLMGLNVDSGDYQPAFERALEMAEYDRYRKEQASRREHGRREADRDRALELHRDVRPRAVEHPRRPPVRGRRLGRRARCGASRAARSR